MAGQAKTTPQQTKPSQTFTPCLANIPNNENIFPLAPQSILGVRFKMENDPEFSPKNLII
jgi:hypothetical protein